MCFLPRVDPHIEAAEFETFTRRVKKEYGSEWGPNPPQWVSSPTVPSSTSSSATAVAAPLVSAVKTSAAARAPASTGIPVAPAQSYPSPRSSPPTPVTSNTASPASSDPDEYLPRVKTKLPSPPLQLILPSKQSTSTSRRVM
ncbi:hypothetical protein FRC17_000652 [Serendipita sp. 399]|nr:hypothetical protein FRC17_000652 [Serendipita sp. 399]